MFSILSEMATQRWQDRLAGFTVTVFYVEKNLKVKSVLLQLLNLYLLLSLVERSGHPGMPLSQLVLPSSLISCLLCRKPMFEVRPCQKPPSKTSQPIWEKEKKNSNVVHHILMYQSYFIIDDWDTRSKWENMVLNTFFLSCCQIQKNKKEIKLKNQTCYTFAGELKLRHRWLLSETLQSICLWVLTVSLLMLIL